MNFRQAMVFFLVIFFNVPIAQALDLEGAFKQGGMVIGRDIPNINVFLDDKPVKVGADGRFVFGFGRDAKSTAILKIIYPNGTVIEQTLEIVKQTYNIERIDGLPPETVTIPEEERQRREKERAMVLDARAPVTDATDWDEGFLLPVEGRLSGFYGSQRILNGEPRWPHYGLDIAAPLNTPVKAPAGGIIRLANEAFLLEGGIIIIDHGFGVSSTLMHLASVNVKEGQRVEKGEIVGALGATGRTSGPHVDWRVNWQSVRIDPALLLELPQTLTVQE